MTFNPQEYVGPVGNYALYSKKIFLTFLQAYFSQYDNIDSRFYWTNDFRTSKLLIVDTRSYDNSTHEKRPAIVVKRGRMGWANTSIDQLYSFNMVTGEPTYTDLIPTSITLSCVGKNGVELEELAGIIMNAITMYKRELRSEGVHSITSISIGEEGQLRGDVDGVFSVVPVNISFVLQGSIAKKYKYYPLTVKFSATFVPETADSTPNPYWDEATKTWFEPTVSQTMQVTLVEDTDYTIETGGVLAFTEAPQPIYYIVEGQQSTTGPDDGTLPAYGSSEGLPYPGYLPQGALTWSVRYVRADTMEASTYTIVPSGSKTDFILPGGIYGYTTIFQHFTLTQEIDEDD